MTPSQKDDANTEFKELMTEVGEFVVVLISILLGLLLCGLFVLGIVTIIIWITT